MSLKQASKGSSVKIVSINASESYINRLSAMGVIPGAEVRVVDNTLANATLIDCLGSRLVLGRNLPDAITIE